ncbi:MAG: DUF4364 family protein [Dorea sp.]|nr:DUF4364 family protein [Dorea sp.]
MTMSSLFNSSFEMGLRVVSLMAVYNKPCTKDRIFCLDFITSYAATFDFPYENLHGNNKYMFGELSNRRALLQEALKDLVTSGLISAQIENKEYVFSVTAAGKKYVSSFKNEYAKEYMTIAKAVATKYKKSSDQDLIGIIQNRSLNSAKGEY